MSLRKCVSSPDASEHMAAAKRTIIKLQIPPMRSFPASSPCLPKVIECPQCGQTLAVVDTFPPHSEHCCIAMAALWEIRIGINLTLDCFFSIYIIFVTEICKGFLERVRGFFRLVSKHRI